MKFECSTRIPTVFVMNVLRAALSPNPANKSYGRFICRVILPSSSSFRFLLPKDRVQRAAHTVNSAFNETEGTLQIDSLKAEFAAQHVLIIQLNFSCCY